MSFAARYDRFYLKDDVNIISSIFSQKKADLDKSGVMVKWYTTTSNYVCVNRSPGANSVTELWGGFPKSQSVTVWTLDSIAYYYV